ncbi:class I SAM-dependent methyltransferase [Mycobacterium sp. shizuoka-1]|uniref:class I SAM-dependent methyltransferase n=1 Tax=Mycobacterium sp. shizuoka-1 TaxID=2039281 RepID=UPI000C06684D|nr:class I SAM-dependent methyltransferase [Mycobacterium sp. shizuoka-1]GAY16900.1 methyltransferase [Mycobacterium sp. shizuoka-1]
MDAEHRNTNQLWWDERAPAHAVSSDYAVRQLIDDPGALSGVVRFDSARLGDLTGLAGIHLQCHIGTDTLSLARLGARMTGLDFSPAAVAVARDIAAQAGLPIDYVQADVYRAPTVVQAGSFDLVYTGVGALVWLPDIRRWAQVVAALLRPGGRLFLREGHPVLWSVDEQRTDAIVLRYPYFEHAEPVRFDGSGTYVDTDAVFTHTETREWNHGLGEIVTALLDAGLRLTMLVEHDSVPWDALPGRMRNTDGEWRLDEHGDRLPLSYTLQAVKP